MALVVDSSAWLAILHLELDAQSLLEAIANADTVHLSAAAYVEVGAVVDAARDPVASRRQDDLLELFQVVIEPVTASSATRPRAGASMFSDSHARADVCPASKVGMFMVS